MFVKHTWDSSVKSLYSALCYLLKKEKHIANKYWTIKIMSIILSMLVIKHTNVIYTYYKQRRWNLWLICVNTIVDSSYKCLTICWDIEAITFSSKWWIRSSWPPTQRIALLDSPIPLPILFTAPTVLWMSGVIFTCSK